MNLPIESRDANHSVGVERAEYVTFFIASEEYGVPILRVREILEFDTLTRVPAAPACVRGVMNLRGSVVPVVDLALKFHQPACVASKRTCIVVVDLSFEGERITMGLMVDAISQTLELGPDDVLPPPPFGTVARSDFLLGMGKLGKKFVMLLNLDRILSVDELFRAVEASSDAPDPAEHLASEAFAQLELGESDGGAHAEGDADG